MLANRYTFIYTRKHYWFSYREDVFVVVSSYSTILTLFGAAGTGVAPHFDFQLARSFSRFDAAHHFDFQLAGSLFDLDHNFFILFLSIDKYINLFFIFFYKNIYIFFNFIREIW